MPRTLQTPDFKSEEEEARWWADNQSLLLNEFEAAAKDGILGRATVIRRGQTPTTTIRLDPDDIELARVQAEHRGLNYLTYLKTIIHQALHQETGRPQLVSASASPPRPTGVEALAPKARPPDGQSRPVPLTPPQQYAMLMD
jgi:hypothetical protein